MSQYTEKEPAAMDQESSKAAWPKPAGGYQTITGRRYGRRHAYVSFKPCMTRHERSLGRAGDDYEVLELDDVPKENSSGSSPSDQVHSSLSNDTLFDKSETEIPICDTTLNQTTESSPSFAAVHPSEEGRETLGGSTDLHNHSEGEYTTEACSASSVQNGISLVQTDSYNPDGTHGETNDRLQLSAEVVEGGGYQEALGNTVFELANGEVEAYTGLSPPVPSFNCEIRDEFEELDSAHLVKSSTGDTEFVSQNNQEFQRSSSEDEVVRKKQQNDTSQESQRENAAEDAVCAPGHICSEQNTSGKDKNQGNFPEQVVRPKVRKLISSSQVDQETGFNRHEAKQRSVQRWREALEVEENGSDDLLIKCDDYDGEHDCMFLDPPYSRVTRRETEHNQITAESGATAGRQEVVENAFWNGCGDYYQLYDKDEDSSECSDGEWSASLPHRFSGTEKDQSSSDESWETLPGKDENEPELQSDSSGPEEENQELSLQEGEQTSLEEGEIPWLQYNEVNESSSDEGNEPANEFAQPEAFMLDGNNNLEDDSSVSEDLDVDWSLFDGFADGLGVAEAISYVDPQFLTYMALEERLAQAMETALAHLESLAVDVEVANPPASKESIDGLPETLVLEDHTAIGQEQCCPICCSEYIKDDIATELPCHHFFHKPCVSIWLQKSGTCPVCRRHFPPAVIEASAAPSSEPDQEAPPSGDSSAEAP
ncbi:E3 ubiquitin-protein ligase Praja-2 isoform X1 [Ursus arctos]|uniref:E3 ubiquitin-protein ligase Praja-2 isoform X1 n=1 Tax=Ursus arctos TaxID=9644 RepID=UPI00201717B0|nr:E3 ubiquitin-protein ligase Praja-2 isoform X1 [Ursus arctos]XP_044239902.2 E3 ubiquitin-protein ligase Praja-2 isoform X1 [Ursus arctos]XP_048076762.1 E3 ubiquitin-protein ligase Praja-2 isoform X1 [Ursus arctos]XP_048076763.1 E3 ubiquitin-protein ligase Praja-2 isoform X1 [Ursus arctos]XP_048076764.1 E3 ubiquitin-protein ligase Praja-2 isoform X1 [Ursus arctos]XP_048076765.1 E3 ubiquitin-protein ligase Praja-2 isoform X1 [Ursus arctos]XP_048076767.1 E3 ubiquitin-protein ligase Praja-2 is